MDNIEYRSRALLPKLVDGCRRPTPYIYNNYCSRICMSAIGWCMDEPNVEEQYDG